MSLFDTLGAIGSGLRVAGGGLSQDAFNVNAQQDENQKTRDEQKKRFLADLLTQHYQQGTLQPQAYQQAMGKLGFDLPPIQPTPDYTGLGSDITSNLDMGGYLSGGAGGQTSMGGATAPSGAQVKPVPQDTVTGQPIPDGPTAPTSEVVGNKVSVYSTDEINRATADFASKIAAQPGTQAMKAKAVKDFRDNLKAERKSLLDEEEKNSLIKNRNSEIAAREREKKPAFVQELEYFTKMSPDDPGYKFMLDKLTVDTNGKKSAVRKNIEADLEAQNIKPGTEEYDTEFHRRMSSYLTKQSAPKAGSDATKLTPEAIGSLAWKSLLFGKNPPGMGNAAASQRAEVSNKAAQIGHKLGLTDAEIAVLPENNKVKMKAADKLTTWGAFVDVASERLTKTIDVAIDYAKKLGPDKVKRLNQAIIAGEREFNDPIANAYAVQVNIVRQDYGRLVTGPTSNAMLPVEAIKKGDELVSTGFDVPTWNEVKKSLLRDAQITKDSVSEQKNALLESVKDPVKKAPVSGGDGWKIEKVQ